MILNGIKFIQYIFEEWCINNSLFSNYENEKEANLYNINDFSMVEQEVIFGLLSQFKNNSLYERSIRHIVYEMYKKFEINNRLKLVCSLKAHKLDRYVPKSLISSGIYDYI